MTGAYLRIKREKWENIEVEHLTDEERQEILKDDPRLMQWLNVVCNKLAETERLFAELEEEGILERAK